MCFRSPSMPCTSSLLTNVWPCTFADFVVWRFHHIARSSSRVCWYSCTTCCLPRCVPKCDHWNHPVLCILWYHLLDVLWRRRQDSNDNVVTFRWFSNYSPIGVQHRCHFYFPTSKLPIAWDCMSIDFFNNAKIMFWCNVFTTAKCHLVILGMHIGARGSVDDGQPWQSRIIDGKFAWMSDSLRLPAINPRQIGPHDPPRTKNWQFCCCWIGYLWDGIGINHDTNSLVESKYAWIIAKHPTGILPMS